MIRRAQPTEAENSDNQLQVDVDTERHPPHLGGLLQRSGRENGHAAPGRKGHERCRDRAGKARRANRAPRPSGPAQERRGGARSAGREPSPQFRTRSTPGGKAEPSSWSMAAGGQLPGLAARSHKRELTLAPPWPGSTFRTRCRRTAHRRAAPSPVGASQFRTQPHRGWCMSRTTPR